MNKKILFPAVLLICSWLATGADAQQLYVGKTEVRYENGNHYCSGINSTVGTGDYSYVTSGNNVWQDSALIEYERPNTNVDDAYPGGCLALCAQLVCVSTASSFGVDDLTFEVFKFGPGANPLDPGSTPPIKTVSMYNIGVCEQTSGNNKHYLNPNPGSLATYRYCTAWDGMYNINGMFGKTNGQFGFRAKVETNRVDPMVGNISIKHTAAYPGQDQIPIQVNVTNIHSVRSSPTVVGKITGVAAQPYNILYRLSKDATTTISIFQAFNDGNELPPVRTIVDHRPRTGEGTPDGTLTNGDFWDGRDDAGSIMPSGLYLARIEAESMDGWKYTDLAFPTTIQIGLDPLQITDVAVKALGASSTDVAVLSYMLTEAATVYVGIFKPGTSFPGGINNPSYPLSAPSPAGSLVAAIQEVKDARKNVSTIWDGRDTVGNTMCDGDYVYAVYAGLHSARAPGGRLYSNKLMVGTLPLARGLPVSFVSPPSSTVIGSSPSISGLDPFYFRYSLVRDAFVTLNIMDIDGVTPIRQIINRQPKSAFFTHREIWDGKNETGDYVPAGQYLASMIVEDPLQCAAEKYFYSSIPFSVDMFRIVDVKTTPLLGGTSDTATISFELSQAMEVDLSIYPTNVVVDPSNWPATGPLGLGTPLYSTSGMRPGRFAITEYWDGRDNSGKLVADGKYPFTIVAHSGARYATDKIYGYVDVAKGQIIFTMFEVTPNIPHMYNSSDTVKLPPYEIDYSVTRQSSVTIKVLDLNIPPNTWANVVPGAIRDGGIAYKEFWDGKDDNGTFVPAGSYNVRIVARDLASQLSSLATVQQTIDVKPFQVFDVAIVPLTAESPAAVYYQLSEPMKVVTKVFKPGTSIDKYGVPSPIDSVSLVKRIIGVRPARTQVVETWDGTDLTLAKVPDGNYVFSVYASTDEKNVNMFTGDMVNGGVLVDLPITGNIPAIKGLTTDLCGDFSRGSFFAPNPYEGVAGWFKIPVLANGTVGLKIYNLAGDLIYKHDFGSKGLGDDIKYFWPKVNSSGRMVAGGVYLAVIRFEATEGAKNVCQTMKKILVP